MDQSFIQLFLFVIRHSFIGSFIHSFDHSFIIILPIGFVKVSITNLHLNLPCLNRSLYLHNLNFFMFFELKIDFCPNFLIQFNFQYIKDYCLIWKLRLPSSFETVDSCVHQHNGAILFTKLVFGIKSVYWHLL